LIVVVERPHPDAAVVAAGGHVAGFDLTDVSLPCSHGVDAVDAGVVSRYDSDRGAFSLVHLPDRALHCAHQSFVSIVVQHDFTDVTVEKKRVWFTLK